HPDAGVTAQHAKMVLGVALVELLPARLAGVRVNRHVDPRHGTVPACLPGALCARDVAAGVELGGRLAEVPDVALPILGVPVGRALAKLPAQIEPIFHDDARDALDPLRPAGDGHDVARDPAVLDAAVDVDGPRLQ